uniref:Uncharacterized protein n=1 Tax=Avena sativa TaxID=4498 RepID=A0ACD5X721_AVESA
MSSEGGKRLKRTPAEAWLRIRDSRIFPQEVWRRGEPGLRPEIGHLVLPRTDGMAERESRFYGRALFVNVVGARRVTAADLLAAMELHCGVRRTAATAKVTSPPHHFFVRFDSAEDCARVLDFSSEMRCGGARLTVRRWSRSARGTPGKLKYNTVLSIEGLPEEAWEPQAVNFVLAGLGGHLVEMLLAEDCWVLPLKAWLHNPSAVPKKVTVTVPAPVLPPTLQASAEEGESPSPPRSPEEKRTQVYNLIVHVKEVIDRGPLLTEGLPSAFLPDEEENLSRKHVFKTWRGKIDGTGDSNFGEA